MSEKNHIMPIKVEYDPSVIRKNKISKEEAEQKKKEYLNQKRELVGSTDNQKLAMESSLGKDERKMTLLAAFNKGECFTTSAGAKLLGLSENTIKNYAKELGISMYDTKTKTWLEGSQPKSVETWG